MICTAQERAESAATPFMLRPPGSEELHTFAAADGEDKDSKSGGRAEKLRVREIELDYKLEDGVSSQVKQVLAWIQGCCLRDVKRSYLKSSVQRLTKSVCFLCEQGSVT